MMYFDRPSLLLLLSVGLLGPLAGLATVNAMNDWKEPKGWDAIFSYTVLLAMICFVGLVITTFLAQMYDDWKDNKSVPGKPVINETPTEKHGLLDMNTGKMINAFRVQAVKIDARKHFAITLWRQLEYHGHDAAKLDLTEEYWLKVKPKKWKGKNEEFRQCMHDWDGVVFQKSDPTRSNSRYVLRDESELKRKADGR